MYFPLWILRVSAAPWFNSFCELDTGQKPLYAVGMTAICVPIFVGGKGGDLEEAISGAEEALVGTLGMIELRCDGATPKQMLEGIDLARVPVIVTVRAKWEGGMPGAREKTDEERIGMWEEAIEAGAEFVDVELVSWEKSGKIREAISELAAKSGTKLIVSNHCFGGRPADLEQRLERLRAVKEADVLKLVWKAESVVDAVEALRMSAAARMGKDRRPVVALAMGEEGILSRILAKKFGAPFTFASVEAGKESAPGQPTVAELRGRYRWEKQTRETPVYGVVGWPVGHSLSPHIHNAGFEAAGFDGVYVPVAVQPTYEAFVVAVDALRASADLGGLSVTIPHKENACRYAMEHVGKTDAVSAGLGVINTLVWRGEDLLALNSDYAGAIDALVSAWTGKRTDVRGKRVAVLGAGGAARAVVAGLVAYGATVVVYNRTREKADTLVAEFGCKKTEGRKQNEEEGSIPPNQDYGWLPGKAVAADWEKLCDSCCEAYINCTPLGMTPKVEGTPIDFDPAWTSETVVFDTVYNPLKTKLIQLAEKRGAKIVLGTEMFVRQAAVQFKEFTGLDADVGLFRRVMMQAMGGGR